MSLRLMYDSTDVGAIPANATMIAVYADGPEDGTLPAAKARFPKAQIVTITVEGQPDRNVADCETGDLTPGSAALWAANEIAAGRKPTIYCNTSTWPSVKDAVKDRGITVSYWVAAYPGDGPVIPDGAVAHQYEGSPGNSPGHYDVSVVAPYWPGVDPTPRPPKPQGFTLLTRRYVKQLLKVLALLDSRFRKRIDSGVPLDAPAKQNVRDIETAMASLLKTVKRLLAL